MDTTKNYPSEHCLVEEFCSSLDSDNSPWGRVNHAREFYYIRGRTDVIAVDENENVYAFELKLDKWRKALDQAYRNTSFANSSYVVVPERVAQRAQRRKHEFERRSVGLCFIRDGEIVVVSPASHQAPVQPWLTKEAADQVMDSNKPNARG